MDTAAQDLELAREQERLFNFLKKYDLQQYYSKFLVKGVHRLTHLKGVLADEASLDEVGLSRIERMRLRRKVKEHAGWKGKIVKKITGKDKQFHGPAPEMTSSITTSEASKEGRRSATIISKDDVMLVRKIGEGAHGSVHEGTWSDIHGAVAVAVKTLYVRQDAEQFIKEANSMTTLHHRHIIQLFGVVLAQPLMLVEELAPFGSLHRYIKKEGAHATLPLLHTYTCQIADAMAYLESRRLVHRDLAIRNILLAQVDYVKLSDFGMARVLDENCEVYNLSNLATRIPIAWTAPEAILHAQFSSASDAWSYGVSLWEIYSLGNVPWKGLSPIEIRDLLVEGQRLGRPTRCPDDIFDLIQACWKEHPQKRPTFADIFKRVKTLIPRQVRAVKAHMLGDDPKALTFRAGDVLYVIDRPNAEWYSGMKMDGTIGHFRADHVSELLNPLDDIRAKVAAGKPVEDLTIGSPTHVDHMVHYFHDGSKWVSENAHALNDLTPPSSPPNATDSRRHTSDPSVNPPPFTVVDSRTPSPRVTSPRSPSAKAGDRLNPLPYQLPMSTLVNLRSPPATTNQHRQVSRSGSVPLALGGEQAPPTRTNTDPSRDLLRLSDLPDVDSPLAEASTPDDDNQYVAIKRAPFLRPEDTKEQDQADNKTPDAELADTYILMKSWPVNRPQSTIEQSSSGSKSRSATVAEGERFMGPHIDPSPERIRSASAAGMLPTPTQQQQWSRTMAGPSYMNYQVISSSSSFSASSSVSNTANPSSASSSHYHEPRSISTSHYQIPRPLTDYTQAQATPTSPPSSDTSPQSLLDTSNTTADLPSPLVPDSSPSKSFRGSGRVDDDFESWKKDAYTPQSTRFLYSNAGVDASTLEPSGGAALPPIPKPRTRHASTERNGIVSAGPEGTAGDQSPSKQVVSGIAANRPQPSRRHLLSDSSAQDLEGHYQPLIPATLDSSVSGQYVMLHPKALRTGGHGVKAVNGGAQGVNGSSGTLNGSVGRVSASTARGADGTTGAQRARGHRNGVLSPHDVRDKDDILDEILQDTEFSGCEVEICKFALEQQDYNLDKAKEEMRVQILLSMLLPHIREEDCRRALVHCQQKTNRAAAWLIQRSEELVRRAQ